MIFGPQLLLVGAVGAVGVLHTIVPDHWVPITLIARQQGWSRAETARASLKAGIGHVLSTLAIALIVWTAGVAFAQRFGHYVDTAASLALIGFGGWIAISSLLEMRGGGHGHSHSHGHGHGHSHDSTELDAIHGPELQQVETGHGLLSLSIFEEGVPPRFRLTGSHNETLHVITLRDDGAEQTFPMTNRGPYWESDDEIPEPHQFSVTIMAEHDGHGHAYETRFTEHSHGGHSHTAVTPNGRQKTSNRTALLLILGSSPMVEGIPAFFAAGKYGVGLIAIMSAVFAATTIATYMVLCVYSTAGLQRVSFGPFERYGEVLSGAFIAAVGLAFWEWPVL